MLDRTRNKILLAVTLTSSFILGLVIQESTAWAYTCAGAVCQCGSWDQGPTGGPKLPDTQWEADCTALAAYCNDQNNSPNLDCSYSGGLWGGSCTCRAV